MNDQLPPASSASHDTLDFLRGGGHMGALMRAFAWESTLLGSPATRPQSLRTSVRLLLNTGHPMYIWWGPELLCLYNDAYSQSIGPERHPGSLGKPGCAVWQEIWHIIGPQIEHVLAGHGATWQENALVPITRYGTREDVYWTYSFGPIDDPSAPNGVGGVLVVCTETTLIVMAEQRRAEELARQRRTFAQAPGFIIIMRGAEHIVDFVNDAHRATFASDDWHGKTIREAFPSVADQGFFELLDRVYATGDSYSAQEAMVRFRRGHGEPEEEHYLNFVYAPIMGEAGEVTGIFCEGFDVTESHASRMRVDELNHTLEKRVLEAVAERRIAETQLRQSQKMEAIGQLTGGLAHDFNNMLAGMSGSLELAKARMEQGRLAEVDRYIDMVLASVNRASALTHRLLAFSRRQTLDPRRTEVNKLVSGMLDLIRRTVGPHIEVDVTEAAQQLPIRIDASQLENALLNLCINARDAMPGGGKLIIETGSKEWDEAEARNHDMIAGAYVFMSVADTGCGMTHEVIEHAFEPFFTTKPLGEGTGLGLSMVHGFARQSGGHVSIHSEIGAGTTVCIHLPRDIGEAVSDEDLVRPDNFVEGNGEVVLVVDDEPTLRQVITEVLSDAGYLTISAADGAAGLHLLNASARIDLLITDVGLPGGMNGRQFAEAARAARPELRILFITGYADTAETGFGRLRSGMEILTKPFPMKNLVQKVRDMLAQQPAGNA
jgi:signal transduction histidine kinase/ActR/RegA family two-component response regulator